MNYNEKQYLQDLTRKEQLEMMKVDFFSDVNLGIHKVENGYVLPTIIGDRKESWRVGGVLDSNRNYIDTSGQYAYGEKTRVYGKYGFNDNDVEYLDYEVIYMNNFIDQWGHFLLDVIGRLWYAVENSDIKIVYTSYLNEAKELKSNFLQLIKLLDIDENRLIYINKIKQFKTVIVPDVSILTAKYYTAEYQSLIDRIIKNALKGYELKRDRKIYCSRKHFSSKRTIEFGEEEIEEIYKNNDYEIVHMEEMNLVDQIRLLNEAKEIVCLAGSLVHNAMFIKNDKCRFIVLNKTYCINQNIYLTNQISKANFTFVDIYLAPLPISMGKGPYIIMPTNEFYSYCKDNGIETSTKKASFNIKILIHYYISYIRKYHKKLLSGKNIGQSKYYIYNIDYKNIRKHYLNSLKNIKERK